MNLTLGSLVIFAILTMNALFGQRLLLSYARRRGLLPALRRLHFFPTVWLLTWLWPITTVGLGVYEIMHWIRKKSA